MKKETEKIQRKGHSKLDLESHHGLLRNNEILNQVQDDGRVFRHDEGRNGFTLIELLVVVLIIGILAAIALPQYQKAVMRSRYATLKNLTKTIATAETVYHLTNDSYTTEMEDLEIGLTGGTFNEESPREYVYPWGYCRVAQQSNTKITITCHNTNISMAYVTVLEEAETPRTSCYVYGSLDPEDFPLQNQICKEETGLQKKTGQNATSLYLRYQY